MAELIFLDELDDDWMNLKLARYLDEKFKSVSIYTGIGGPGTSPGPEKVWFDVDPSTSDRWLVIRRLQAFLDRYDRCCHLRPYTYEGGGEAPKLGWSLTIPPSKVRLLASFIQLEDAEEAARRAEREAFDAEEAAYRAGALLEGAPPMSTREPKASPFEAVAFGPAEKGATL